MNHDIQRVDSLVEATKPAYEQFYRICLKQKALNIGRANRQHGDNENASQATVGYIEDLYFKVLEKIKSHGEMAYTVKVWVTLATLSHQLLVVNQDRFPKRVPYMKAHFSYCCRHLVDAYPHGSWNGVLDCIYTITHSNREHVKALVEYAPVLDMRNWREVPL